MRFIFLFLVILTSACSSSSNADDWSEWKRCGVEKREMRWDFCSKDLHGEEYAKRGFCYVADECRYRTTMWPFRNEKVEMRTKLLFCPFPKSKEDYEAYNCLNEHGINDKVIMSEPIL